MIKKSSNLETLQDKLAKEHDILKDDLNAFMNEKGRRIYNLKDKIKNNCKLTIVLKNHKKVTIQSPNGE